MKSLKLNFISIFVFILYKKIYIINTLSASCISPVAGFSILSSNYLTTRNESLTTPLASPECTPSVKTLT